ncbi:MAG TPA: NUDIX hydrolase [Gemmatimonadaceae bacterium]|nr:NUDIX hydrolase [Gemmatimonadaceae bacterium]
MTRAHAKEETSAGGVVYRVVDGSPVYLLIRDSYRNWGFPKGHVEDGELPDAAALREVSEETGLSDLVVRGLVQTIDWHFRFRGKLIHKICHFYLMETAESTTSPQRTEGITACRWLPFNEAEELISYANARDVLRRARALVPTATTSSSSI